MSSVDERIVEMRFDNQQFESGVKTSLSTLDRLKNSLNGLDGSADSLSNFQTQAGKFNISTLADSLEVVANRFSTFGIMADQAIRLVTSSLMRLGFKGLSVIKNLTVSPIFSGFGKYEEESKAIQVLMNATGEGMETVEGYAEKLRWYTNETSYSYQDMLKYASQFTSSGVKMEDAIGAMMGIANAAGMAGSTTEQASHAMQGLSIAIGQGYLDSRAWTWVKTARMDTMQFKNELIDAGVAAGTLVRETDKAGNVLGTYIAKNGKADTKLGEVTAATFDSFLSQKWITKDVLTGKEYSVLNKYAKAVEQIYTEYLNDPTKLTNDIIDELGDSLDEFSLKAFRAANETRTFSDAIQYIKDASSTGWAKTFKLIFGNYEESVSLWGDVTEKLYDIFLADLDSRNDMLQEWHDSGGYQNIVDSILNVLDGFVNIKGRAQEAFNDIFPEMSAERLKVITEGIKDLTERFKEFTSEETDNELFRNLIDGFQGILSVVSLAGKGIKAFLNVLSPVVTKIETFGIKIIEILGDIGRYLTELNKKVTAENFFDKIAGFIPNLKTKLESFKSTLETVYDKVSDFLGEKFTKIADGIKDVINNPSWESFAKVGMTLGALFTGVNLFRLGDHIKWFYDCLTGFPAQVIDFLGTLEDTIWDYGKNQTAEILKKVATSVLILAAALLLLSSIDSDKLAIVTGAVAGLFGALLGSVKFLSGFFGKGGVFSALTSSNIASFMVITTSFLKIAVSILILAAALKIIDSLNPDTMMDSMFNLVVMIGVLTSAIVLLSKFADTTFNMKAAGKAFKSMGVALLLAAAALAIIDKFVTNPDTIFNALVLISAMAGIMTLMSNFSTSGKKLVLAGAALIAASAALLIIAGALAILDKIGAGTDTIMNAIIAIGGMAAILVLMSNFAKSGSSMMAAGVALIAASAALLIMAGALAIIEKFAKDPATIMNAISIFGGIALILGIIGSLGASVGVGMIAAGAGLILASAALLILAGALAAIAAIPLNSVYSILLGLMAFIGVFALTGAVAGLGMVAAGAGLLLMAAAIAILTPALLALGAASETAMNGVLILIGVFIALGAAGYLLLPLIPAILAFAGTLLVVSVAMVAAGAAGLVFSAAMLSLSASIPSFVAGILTGLYLLIVGIQEFVASLLDMAATIVRIIPGLGAILGNDLNILANDFRNNVERMNLQEIIAKATEDIPSEVENVAPEAGDAATAVGESISSNLEESTSNLGEVGSKAAEDFVNGFTSMIPDAGLAGEDLSLESLTAMLGMTDEFSNAGTDNGMSFINALGALSSDSEQAGTEFGGQSIAGIASLLDQFNSTGGNAADGFIMGLASKYGDAFNAGSGLGQSALEGAQSAIDSHSPSKEFAKLGRYSGQGYELGMKSMFNSIYEVSSEMGNIALEAISDSLNYISDYISSDEDFNPVITPVVDLSNVENAGNGISRYFNSNMPLNITGATVAGNSRMEKDASELIYLGYKILGAIQNGSDLYFDDGALAGRINRRLGAKI